MRFPQGAHMALYLLSYDVTEKNHDYQSLWDFLDEMGATRIPRLLTVTESRSRARALASNLKSLRAATG